MAHGVISVQKDLHLRGALRKLALAFAEKLHGSVPIVHVDEGGVKFVEGAINRS